MAAATECYPVMTARSGTVWRRIVLAFAALSGGSIAAYSLAKRAQPSDDLRPLQVACELPQTSLQRDIIAYLQEADVLQADDKPVLLTRMNAHFAGVDTLSEARARATAAGATCPTAGTQSLDGRPFDCSVEVVCRRGGLYGMKTRAQVVRASFDLDRQGAISVLVLSKGASGEYSRHAAEKVRGGIWAKEAKAGGQFVDGPVAGQPPVKLDQ